MKKKWILIFLFTVLLFCLAGCKEERTVLHSTEGYTIHRVGSQCYLDMTYGNQKLYLNEDGCVIHPRYLEFESVEQIYQAFMQGALSIEDLQVIQYAFPLDDHGFLIPDPQKLYDLELPAGMECWRIELQTDTCSFCIYGNGIDGIRSAGLSIISEQKFREDLRNYRNIETSKDTFDRITAIEERNATAYDYTNEHGQYRRILYCIENQSRTLYVIENYDLTGSGNSATVPTEINILGQTNGAYYTLDLYVDERPEISDLEAISPIPYQPK